LCDFLPGGRFQLIDDGSHGEIDAALQIHRVRARRHRLCTFLDDGLREQGRGGGAVAGGIGGL
jgi:hypothetical protein